MAGEKNCDHAGPCLCPRPGELKPRRMFTDAEAKAKAGRLLKAGNTDPDVINAVYYPGDAAVILAALGQAGAPAPETQAPQAGPEPEEDWKEPTPKKKRAASSKKTAKKADPAKIGDRIKGGPDGAIEGVITGEKEIPGPAGDPWPVWEVTQENGETALLEKASA